MSTTTTDLNAAVKARAEEIVADGEHIRPRLAEVVTQNVCQSHQSGEGLVGLVRAVVDGAREGLARAVPEDRDDVLRQVVDALGDGLSRTALAGRLAVEEGVAASRQYAKEDLVRLGDDLTAIRELFTETVARGLSTCKALTASQVAAAQAHAERVAERLGPKIAQAHDAVRRHPIEFAREGLQAGVSMGQGAAGALFQALGRLLERAGDQLRRESVPDRSAAGS
jgi:GGDEF domain-containing protein